MATTYGVTSVGFVLKQQSVISSEITTALQAVFGANINTGAESVFGQMIGIFSEREALIWQLAEAVYNSQYPAGAEGTSVDNILSLNNLKRLPASATVTNPEALVQANGISLFPLVLKGTPGTIIPSGSTILTTASPPLTFTLNASVIILAAVNAVQSIFFSNTPTQGAFSISIADAAGDTLTTPSINWNASAAQTTVTFASTPVSGHWVLVMTQAGAALSTVQIGFSASSGTLQTAIRNVTGYSGVSVSGSPAAGYTITWNSICNPLCTTNSNTLGVVITVVDSAQAAFNNLLDSTTSKYPYTDVVVTSSGQNYIFTFGTGTVVGSNPVSSAQPQALILEVTNTLQNGSTVTNMNIVNTTAGSPAEGIGAATCSVTGPNFVAANTLTVIGSPVSGWASVTNQLDCITGTNVETDTQALLRRSALLAAQANGPLQAIVEKVQEVSGVTTAIGFQNLTGAAQQNVVFSSVPISGSFSLTLGGEKVSGLAYNISASTLQTQIQTLTGYSAVLVTGNVQYGFVINFNGAFGGQGQSLAIISANTTGVTITPSFGRPPKSFEIVAEGGTDLDIATSIYGSMPAGISSYGNTTVQITDAFGNLTNISFSRPTQIPIYVNVTLITDQYLIPGNSGSGVNPNAKFNPQTIETIQTDLIDIGNAFGIGGLVIGFGTDGLVGCFNSVLGIISYTLYFDTSPSPISNANIQLQSEQIAIFETFNVTVSYT